MVFSDLSKYSQSDDRSENSSEQRIAPVSDRLLAFCFDVVLFSPVFSLILSQIFQKIEYRYYTDPGSTEFSVFVGLGIFGVALLTLICQTLALWQWGTTPGKYFFKLKVVSISGQKVHLNQALLRSGIWILEIFFLGLAFFEILSQKQRRPLHDRSSDTMVVTLKKKGDLGPHPLEAHFVKNLLMMFSSVVAIWSIVMVVQVYHLANTGDFKRAELDSRDYLCPNVSEFSDKDETRADLALALYIAGEVEDECLTSEADFALWTDNPEQQAWGYLAKSVLFQYDEKKSSRYLNKVCETDSGESCRIAEAMRTENREQILKNPESLTAQVMQIRELSNRGVFSGALKSLQQLTSQNEGFQHYSQKQRVKFLWTLNRKQEAYGAYANTWSFLNPKDQADLSAWMCSEEVSDRCDNRNYHSCNDLKENLLSTQFAHVSTEAVLGLVGEAECKKTSSLSLVSFHKIFEENVSLRDLVLAISSDSDWSELHRLETLRQLSLAKKGSISRVVQRRAQVALLERSKDPKDSLALLKFLKSSDRHDWAWMSLMKKLNLKSKESGQLQLASELNKVDQRSVRAPASESEK